MGDGPRGIELFSDHFAVSCSDEDALQSSTPDYAASTSSIADVSSPTSSLTKSRSHRHTQARRKLKTAVSLLNVFRALSLGLGEHDEDKVVLSVAEVRTLRSELSALDQRESHRKAQIEHINEVLHSARLSGYLLLRMRWATFPGEPPPVDDTEVDDWLPRFIVLTRSCIYLYMKATDISPQDCTLLTDVIEVGPLPPLTQEDEETRHCFYILTRYGLRYECSSTSQIQVNSWLEALQIDSKMISDSEIH